MEQHRKWDAIYVGRQKCHFGRHISDKIRRIYLMDHDLNRDLRSTAVKWYDMMWFFSEVYRFVWDEEEAVIRRRDNRLNRGLIKLLSRRRGRSILRTATLCDYTADDCDERLTGDVIERRYYADRARHDWRRWSRSFMSHGSGEITVIVNTVHVLYICILDLFNILRNNYYLCHNWVI